MEDKSKYAWYRVLCNELNIGFSDSKLSEIAQLDGKQNGFWINSITVPGNCYLLTRYKIEVIKLFNHTFHELKILLNLKISHILELLS